MKYHKLLISTLFLGCSAPQVATQPDYTPVDPCPKTTTIIGNEITNNFAITVAYNKLQSKMDPACREYKIGSAELIAKSSTDQYRIILHLKRGKQATFAQVGGPYQDSHKDEYPLINCTITTDNITCSLNSIFDPKSLSRTVNNPFKYEHGMVEQKYVSPCNVLESGRFNSQYKTDLELMCFEQQNTESSVIGPVMEAFNALTKLIQREK
jgi:hypothetical protein